jgi:hypothetical protein
MSPIKEPHFFSEEVRANNFDSVMKAKAAARTGDLCAWLDGPGRRPFSGGPIETHTDYISLFREAGPVSAGGREQHLVSVIAHGSPQHCRPCSSRPHPLGAPKPNRPRVLSIRPHAELRRDAYYIP